MNRLTKLMLERRGMDWNALKELDNPSHRMLLDCDVAAERLHLARMAGWKVVVLPDFDMDGISSGVLGHAALCEMGFDCELFEPDPNEGYGASPATIDRLVSEHPGVRLILTCDVGIGCRAAAMHARDLGIEMVVTDHHIEDRRLSPVGVASAVVDPCRIDDAYEHSGICGAHVLWQVLEHYARVHGTRADVDQVSRLRVFAGLGTISDSMPLLYENRQLVRDAMSILRMTWSCGSSWFVDSIGGHPAYRAAFVGLKSVCDAYVDAGKISKASDIDEGFVGYYLAPMFNSCKRMGEPLSTAFGVFAGDNVGECVDMLMQRNEERKALVEAKMAELLSDIDADIAPYIYVVDAPAGILGLLAGRMESRTGLPCMVVASDGEGGYHGSGRSPAWYRFIARAHDHAAHAAGHDAAFGCRFDGYAQMAAMADFLERDTADVLAELDEAGGLGRPMPDVTVALDGGGDCGLDVPLISEFVHDLETMKPFGRGFAEPDVCLRFDAGSVDWAYVGSGDKHVKALLPQGVALLMWNQPGFLDTGNPTGIVEAHGSFGFNEFMGNRSLQFVAERLENAQGD